MSLQWPYLQTAHCSYVCMDSNNQNKGLIRIKMLNMIMSIGKFWSNSVHLERNCIEMSGLCWSFPELRPCKRLFQSQLPVLGWSYPHCACVPLMSARSLLLWRRRIMHCWALSLTTETSRNKSRTFRTWHRFRVRSFNCREKREGAKCYNIGVLFAA